MSELAGIAIILGSVIAMIYTPFVFIPDRAREWISRFPRNRWAGWLLTAGDLIWAAWLIFNASLGRFEGLKPWLWVLVPVIFFLVVYFMDELLASRALGGLLVLLPAPLLSAARWHESAFRYVIVVLAYIMVIKGIILVLSPYQFRKWTALLIKRNSHCRTWGFIGLMFGVFIILLGITVF